MSDRHERARSRAVWEVDASPKFIPVAALSILIVLSGCKSPTATTVTGGVVMGVGGVTAASFGVGLASSTEASNNLGVKNPLKATYVAGTVIGLVIFVAGAIVLARGVSMRSKEVKARKAEQEAEARQNKRASPRRPSRRHDPVFIPRDERGDDSAGASAARKLFRRLDSLVIEDVRPAFESLDAIERSLFLVEWRTLSEKLDSVKGREFYSLLRGEGPPLTSTSSAASSTTSTSEPRPPLPRRKPITGDPDW